MEGSYKIYISYELSNRLELLCYDPDGKQWIDVPRQPEVSMEFKKTLAVRTKLLLFGREVTGLRVIYKFSILTNSWSLGRGMNEPRWSFGSASLGDIAIVAGGYNAKGNILSSAQIYNSDTGTWVSLPRMNRPTTMCSGVFMDGNFYVVGNGVGNPNVLTCGEKYDLETSSWHVILNMFPARRVYEAPPLLVVAKNELYAFFYWENEARKYDKGRNLWSTVGNLPEGVRIGGWGLALRAYGDRLILIVGEPSPGGVEVYYCVLDEPGPLQWNLLAVNYEPGLPEFGCYDCTVMGC